MTSEGSRDSKFSSLPLLLSLTSFNPLCKMQQSQMAPILQSPDPPPVLAFPQSCLPAVINKSRPVNYTGQIIHSFISFGLPALRSTRALDVWIPGKWMNNLVLIYLLLILWPKLADFKHNTVSQLQPIIFNGSRDRRADKMYHKKKGFASYRLWAHWPGVLQVRCKKERGEKPQS